MLPVVGIPACAIMMVKEQLRHDTPARYSAAVLGGAGAVPVLIPPMGESSLAVLDRIDGLLLPGSPSNVHPSHYAGGESETPDRHDLERDATTLRLIPEALARGMPLLAICRGIQELNVSLGGTLHQQVHEVPTRMDHRPSEARRSWSIRCMDRRSTSLRRDWRWRPWRQMGRLRLCAWKTHEVLRSVCSGILNGATRMTAPASRSSVRSAMRAVLINRG
jgi:gamma-glutamyl-gamma-aminobutyrate hydrolase PuuD